MEDNRKTEEINSAHLSDFFWKVSLRRFLGKSRSSQMSPFATDEEVEVAFKHFAIPESSRTRRLKLDRAHMIHRVN